jgi:serine/threonine-protein kinase
MSQRAARLRLSCEWWGGAVVEQTHDEEWREISPYLDEVLDLDIEARPAWLHDLETRAPDIAARVRSRLLDLAELDKRNFLGAAAISLLSAASLAGETFGSYTLDHVIGHGGMGTVWLAHRSDGRFEGQVAVKLLNAALIGHPTERRFAREGSVLAKLKHPNIAHLLDAGVAGGSQPYLVLEYVRGERIDQYCEQHRLTIEQRIALFLDVVAAVAHAHSNLIVHRDIKPSNILVNDDGVVKLLDFGVAALLSTSADDATNLTSHIATGLTPGYAAPEQLLGEAVTTATDVYALGLVLFVLLAGRHPSNPEGKTANELMRLTLETDAPRPSEIASETGAGRSLRGDLDNIIAMTLRRNPAERYSTAELLAQDLRRYLAFEPVSARPQSFRYIAAKFVRRNRFAVLSASAVALALLGTGGFAVWQMIEANLQRRAAQDQAARAESTRDFLQFVLTDAGTSGRPFTTSELLTRAEGSIRAQYGSGESRLAVEQLLDLGVLFAGLRQNRKALELIETAHERASKGGYVDLRRQSACEWGRQLHYAERLQEGGRILDATIAELRLQAPESPALVDCLQHKSDLNLTREDIPGGVALAQDSVALAMRIFPGSPSRQIAPRIQLATAYRLAGELAMADDMYRKTVELLQGLGRDRSADAVGVYSDWALVRSDIGDVLGAAKLIESSLEVGRALRPDAEPDQVVGVNYAKRLLRLNRLEDSEQYFSHARLMAHQEGEAGMEAIALLGIVAVKREQQDLDAAHTALRAAEDFVHPRFPAGHPARVSLLFETGLLYLAERSFLQAVAVLEDVAAQYSSSGTGGPNELLTLIALAQAEIGLGRSQSAAAHAARARALANRFALGGQPSYWVGHSLLVQAEVETALGHRSAARALAADALAQLTPTVGREHPAARKAAEITQAP